MLQNVLAGGAAANVMAKTLGVEFALVDAGDSRPALDGPDLASVRIGHCTYNSAERPATSMAQCRRALREGRSIGGEPGHEAAWFGEMGLDHTSSASLVTAKLLGLPVSRLTGRGTGLDDDGLATKRRILEADVGSDLNPHGYTMNLRICS